MASLEIIGLKKSFGPQAVVQDFNLGIDSGEFISLLGPSGCGKTTVLRMLAGFETPSDGTIRLGGQDVTRLSPTRRKIGMVFQAYALFPNMTVAQNVAFGCKVAKWPAAETAARVTEMLALVGLPSLGDRYPFQLSGGQQQRVALARALAPKPRALLLDEPLSALDAKIRVSLREEIRALQRELKITTVFVTHDQEEALSLSDRIVVMYGGRAEQIGTAPEIYNEPRTRFVASFVGTLNVLDARILDPHRAEIDGQVVTAARVLGAAGDTASLALRREAISLTPGAGDSTLTGTVGDVSFLGSIVRIKIALGRQTLSLDTFNRLGQSLPERGETVTVGFGPGDLQRLEEEQAA